MIMVCNCLPIGDIKIYSCTPLLYYLGVWSPPHTLQWPRGLQPNETTLERKTTVWVAWANQARSYIGFDNPPWRGWNLCNMGCVWYCSCFWVKGRWSYDEGLEEELQTPVYVDYWGSFMWLASGNLIYAWGLGGNHLLTDTPVHS